MREGGGTYCSNNRVTLDLDNVTSSIVNKLSSCERIESSRWIVNGVARGCGSRGADRGRPLVALETADSGPQKTSSEHCDMPSLALASTAWGLSPLVASRRRRSTISFSISAFRLSTVRPGQTSIQPKSHWNSPAFGNPFKSRLDFAFNLQSPTARTRCSWSLHDITSKLSQVKRPTLKTHIPRSNHPDDTYLLLFTLVACFPASPTALPRTHWRTLLHIARFRIPV